jgi:PAS domain S-box-containing protein
MRKLSMPMIPRSEQMLGITPDDVLLADEIHLRSYLEAALEGILAVNCSGRIVFMNGHTEQMFGYPRKEIIGHSLMALMPQRFQEHYMSALRAYFDGPTVRMLGMEMNLVARRKDGKEFPVEIGLSFINGKEGTIALGFITDVTERKRINDELKRLNGALLRSNGELEQFAHLVSHDLQEPLCVIIAYLALLKRRYHKTLNAEAGEFLDLVVDGASRMKKQIEDLLNLSRVGAIPPALRCVPCEKLLQRAVNNLREAIAERSAQVTWGPMPEISADFDMLSQVFQNLIANGIKFNKAAAPCVHVSAARQDSDWVFSVRDNGIGIEAAQRDRVFQVFERLHPASEFPGTGVGLTITRKIVERHKGLVWFESKLGEGSTFFFSLPRSPAI